MENCPKKQTLNCPTCKMELEEKYLGKRCPRCNSVVIFNSCKKCGNKCGIMPDSLINLP